MYELEPVDPTLEDSTLVLCLRLIKKIFIIQTICL